MSVKVIDHFGNRSRRVGKPFEISRVSAEMILILTVMARSSSYLLMKIGVGNMEPVTLIAFRFLSAFLVCAVLFPKRIREANRATVSAGVSIGILMFLILYLQMVGIQDISSSSAGFLASTTVIFVPLIQAVKNRKLPEIRQCACIVVTMFGIALLTVTSGFMVSRGSVFYVLGALIYAVHIIMTQEFSQETDLFTAGIIELFVTGALALAVSLVMEDFHIPDQASDWQSSCRWPFCAVSSDWRSSRNSRNIRRRNGMEFSVVWARCFPVCSGCCSCRNNSACARLRVPCLFWQACSSHLRKSHPKMQFRWEELPPASGRISILLRTS